MVLQPVHYILLGLAGFSSIVWSLISMGVIKTRDSELYTEKERYIQQAVNSIEETYRIMESMPKVSHDNIRSFLDQGQYTKALEEARVHHDVFHFFKNY